MSRKDLEQVAEALESVSPEAHGLLKSILTTWCALEPGKNVPTVAFLDAERRPVLVDAFLPQNAVRFTPETWGRASICERMSGVAYWKTVVPFRMVLRGTCPACGRGHELLDWTGPENGGWTRKTVVLCTRRRRWEIHAVGEEHRFADYGAMKRYLYPEA